MTLRLERLSPTNFADYERLTRAETNGKTGCYCAFWHQKWTSSEEWERRQREAPEKNCQVVRTRMESGFHVGALAYDGDQLLAWLAVAPLGEVYWTQHRLAQLGPAGLAVAGLACLNLAPEARGHRRQGGVLRALAEYARDQGWSALEGYPFDEEAFARHGDKVAWPGTPKGFVEAGFIRSAAHWLSNPEWPRSIYRMELTREG